MSKIKLTDLLPGLSARHAVFVVEYMKDFAVQRAAEAAGFGRDSGSSILRRDDVSAVIEGLLIERLEHNMIDADWLLYEMIDNHMIARQMGNITASNTALSLVAKHKRVDAFAADKIKVSTDADVVDRLTTARRRLAEDQEGDEVSFL